MAYSPFSVSRYMTRLTQSLNYAIAISLKRNPHSPTSAFVRAVILVKGIHFYGFHTSYSPFLKVHMADPAFMHRAVAILQSGTVMGTRFRIFESHLNYTLQFLCDFGLYGCGWIDLDEVWRRGDEEEDTLELAMDTEFKQSPCYRQSRMPLEVDTIAANILNRRFINARNIHHNLIIPEPHLPEEPLVLGVRELWEDERRRRLKAGLLPTPEVPADPSANSRGRGAEWVAEVRWWADLKKRIESDKSTEFKISELAWEKWVMTTFESAEALWDDSDKTWTPGGAQDTGTVAASYQNPYEEAVGSMQCGPGRLKLNAETDIDINEILLSSQDFSDVVDTEQQEDNAYADQIAGPEDLAAETGEDVDDMHRQLEPIFDRELTHPATLIQHRQDPMTENATK